jgi:probable rRNA maturation factor
MKVFIETNLKRDCPLSQKEMETLFKKTLKEAGFLLAQKKLSLSVAFVSPLAIQKMNQRYRRKNSPTDVLSFGDYADSKKLKKEKKNDIFLGELVICCSVVKKSAKLNEVSFRNEFGYIFSHGILHLLGFDHGEKMFAIQEEAIKELK